jgi:DnaJ-class molecular chaperone
MATKRDLYKILGVPPTATPEDIRKAYRALSKKYHPDLNPDLKKYSDEKMKELVEAYNVLNDQAKRKEYDKQPQFQPRRFVKDSFAKTAQHNKTKQMQEKGKAEPSLLQKLLPGLFKNKNDGGGSVYDPKQADVHFTLGLSMTENESFYDQAKGEFKLALKFRPDHKEAQYNFALMCYKLGEFDEALLQFQKVTQLDKEDPHARKMISILHEEY